jgi:hypothetical protein
LIVDHFGGSPGSVAIDSDIVGGHQVRHRENI